MNYWEAAEDGDSELELGQEDREGWTKRCGWGETGELRTRARPGCGRAVCNLGGSQCCQT